MPRQAKKKRSRKTDKETGETSLLSSLFEYGHLCYNIGRCFILDRKYRERVLQ